VKGSPAPVIFLILFGFGIFGNMQRYGYSLGEVLSPAGFIDCLLIPAFFAGLISLLVHGVFKFKNKKKR